MPSKTDILDMYFMDARWKLLDIAAFLDRLDRASGEEDFRAETFRKVMQEVLECDSPERAKTLLEALSDPSSDPADQASIQFAIGAHAPSSASN